MALFQSNSRTICALLIAALAAVAIAYGQEEQTQKPPEPGAIRVQVNEVIVPVTVTDDKGRFVSNLEESDFKIFDEGKEQKILYFSREHKQPVVVGFLVDMSNASRIHWNKYKEAVEELILTMLPNDKKYSGYLISYSNEAELQVNTTSDPEKLLEKVRKMKPGGGAALYDAVWMACTSRSLVKGEPIEPRRVVIVIGDGHDSASKRHLEEVLEIAQRNLVTIYGVSTVAFGFNVDGEKNLTKLAEDTGGRVEYPLQKLYSGVSGYLSTPSDEGNYALKVGTGGYASEIASGIFRAVANVAGEVTTQYIIRYIPDNADTGRVFRSVEVKVNLPSAKVRARKGYFPFGPEVTGAK